MSIYLRFFNYCVPFRKKSKKKIFMKLPPSYEETLLMKSIQETENKLLIKEPVRDKISKFVFEN